MDRWVSDLCRLCFLLCNSQVETEMAIENVRDEIVLHTVDGGTDVDAVFTSVGERSRGESVLFVMISMVL